MLSKSVDKLQKGMNSLLPGDIYVKKIEEVPDDFHARFLVKEKIYKIFDCYACGLGFCLSSSPA